MAAARLSLPLRPPPRLLLPPALLSRDFVPVCAQAQFCSRQGPRRARRTASAAPWTTPPLLAGCPRTTPTLSPSRHSFFHNLNAVLWYADSPALRELVKREALDCRHEGRHLLHNLFDARDGKGVRHAHEVRQPTRSGL